MYAQKPNNAQISFVTIMFLVFYKQLGNKRFMLDTKTLDNMQIHSMFKELMGGGEEKNTQELSLLITRLYKL